MKKRYIPRYLCVPDLKVNASPKWIPLSLYLLDDYRMKGLRDVDRWHYVGICLLAARCGNRLRGDAEWIGERIRASEPVDLLRLIDAELLASAGQIAIQSSAVREVSTPSQARGKSRHDLQTLREYAASRPNARSVRELAGYFARTGAADDEVDAWLKARDELQATERERRERESEEVRQQYAEFIAEIAARGGPRDEIERMIWDARPQE